MVVGIPTDKYPLDTDLIFKREIRIQGVYGSILKSTLEMR